MDELQRIADRNGLMIIEDSAQALGSRYKGKHAGTFGLAALQFLSGETPWMFGDGGAVVTNDDRIAEKLFIFRDHGRNKDGRSSPGEPTAAWITSKRQFWIGN